MGFWDELVDKTKQVGEVAGNKADELVQKGKIKYQLEKLTYTLKGQQRKLGSLVYGMHRAGTQNEKLLEQWAPSWHHVTVYGDYRKLFGYLFKMKGIKVLEEDK